MKKYLLLVCLCIVTPTLQAQLGDYPVSLDASTAVEAPPSNIDFLRRSLGASNLSGVASSAAVETDRTKSSTVPSAADKTPVPTAVAVTSAEQPAPQKSSRVLDMPLAAGGSVQAAVPATKSSSNNAVQKQKNPNKVAPTASRTTTAASSAQEQAAQAELDYAARMLKEAKKESVQGRFIPQTPSQTGYVPAAETTPSRGFNPNDYRPGVEWQRGDSTHFIIYTQKRDGGIGSSNMSMLFESAYQTLRRNIPWMMSDKVRVFVYQDHTSYLNHEPNAKAWTRALAYPTRGEIVVYDEPGKQQELKEVFTHELVHIFTQKFFDKYKSGRLMTPTWLDEGLAVYMEDQVYSGRQGGPWAKDLRTLNLQRNPKSRMSDFSSSNMFGSRPSSFGSSGFERKGPPVYFMPFDEFMREDSLSAMEARNKTQDWYLQAYAMVRFLLNPAGGTSPSNRMQFEQFTRLISQGEQVRDPSSGLPVKDSKGKPMYRPYSTEKAMGRSYRYNSPSNFEDAFWRWANTQH